MTAGRPLDGLKILVVEDEFLIALEVSRMIRDLGGEVLGPASSLAAATELVQSTHVDGALVDFSLGSDNSTSLAQELMARGVPTVLATGYGNDVLPDSLAQAPRVSKPYTRSTFRDVVSRYFTRRDLPDGK